MDIAIDSDYSIISLFFLILSISNVVYIHYQISNNHLKYDSYNYFLFFLFSIDKPWFHSFFSIPPFPIPIWYFWIHYIDP